MVTIPTPDFSVVFDAAVIGFGMVLTVSLLQNAGNFLRDGKEFLNRANDSSKYRNRSRGDMYNKFHK